MPSTKPTLTNCYTPSLSNPHYRHNITSSPNYSFSKRPSGSSTTNNNNNTNQTENQTRNSKTIRHLCLDRSILSSSSGSSLVELGHTKVLCSVQGPRPVTSSTLSTGSKGREFHSNGVLNCELRFAPVFGTNPETRVMTTATNLDGYTAGVVGGGGGGGDNTQEVELSSRLHDAISPSVPLDLLMKSVVDVFVMVLQDDGSVLAASTIAASMALCDAGIEVYDMVSACSVAVVKVPKSLPPVDNSNDDDGDDEFQLLADPVEDELLAAEGVITLAMMSNWKEVTFWDQTGRLPPKIASEAAELCRDGCTTMSKFVRQCLIGG